MYQQGGFSDEVRLERWSQVLFGPREFPEGVEIFVLEGEFEDESGPHAAGTFLRLPAGARHSPKIGTPCSVYVKEGGFAYLESSGI